MPDIVDLTGSGDEATLVTMPPAKKNKIHSTKQPLPPSFHTRVMATMDLTGTDDDDSVPPPVIPDLAAAKLRPAAKVCPAPKRSPVKKKIQAKLMVLSVTVPRPSKFASLVVRSDKSGKRKPAACKKCPAEEDPPSFNLVHMPFSQAQLLFSWGWVV